MVEDFRLWSEDEIVTVPDSIIDKMNRLGKELNEVALAKSRLFRDDALAVGIEFK